MSLDDNVFRIVRYVREHLIRLLSKYTDNIPSI